MLCLFMTPLGIAPQVENHWDRSKSGVETDQNGNDTNSAVFADASQQG